MKRTIAFLILCMIFVSFAVLAEGETKAFELWNGITWDSTPQDIIPDYTYAIRDEEWSHGIRYEPDEAYRKFAGRYLIDRIVSNTQFVDFEFDEDWKNLTRIIISFSKDSSDEDDATFLFMMGAVLKQCGMPYRFSDEDYVSWYPDETTGIIVKNFDDYVGIMFTNLPRNGISLESNEGKP